MNRQAWIAEFIGTFALIFVGIGAIVNVGAGGGTPAGLLTVALAHGLTIAVMVSATMAISGGHLNPAVTLGALLGGKISVGNAVSYWTAQVGGAIVAAFLIQKAMPAMATEAVNLGTPLLAEGTSIQTALILEGVGTFFLVFVVFGTGIDPRAHKVGGLFIGLTITIGILVAGPLTGGALNPARHLGPALVGSHWANWWVYLAGPLSGGAIAGLIYRWALTPKS